MFFSIINGQTMDCGCIFIPYKIAEQQHRYIMNSDYLASPYKLTKYRMKRHKRREWGFLPEIPVLVTASVIKRNS
jgi:hypothetical protein